MLQGARPQPSAAAAGGLRSDSGALARAGGPPRAAASAGAGAGKETLVRRSAVAPCVTCGLCGRLLRDAAAFPECLHAFCRKCVHDKCAKEDINCCPTCGIYLGCAPLDKLRSMIFPAKRRKVAIIKKTKERLSVESTLSSAGEVAVEGSTALPPAASQSKAQKIVVGVIDEVNKALVTQELVYESSTLNLAPVGRDVLARIKCRDFYSACSLTAETGALIVWQSPPIVKEIIDHDQLSPRQDPEIFEPPATSHTEYQRQAPTAQTTNTLAVARSSSHAMTTVQDDENLRGDILTMFNESNARIMARYDAYISQLKAENAKLIEKLENERADAVERTSILEERLQRGLQNERAVAVERTRILEERLQRELENERESAVERIRILEERLQRESEIAQTNASRSQALEAENARLYQELENGRADNQALMSDILEKSDELATLKYYSDMFESDRTYLESQVEHLKMELEYTRKYLARYARQVLDAARAVPNNLEAHLGHDKTGGYPL